MTTQQLLFDAPHYPATPGFKEQGGASEEAARSLGSRAESLRHQCLAVLKEQGSKTTDEVAEILGEDVLSIRPRFTELFKNKQIKKTDLRRESSRGRSQTVWRTA